MALLNVEESRPSESVTPGPVRQRGFAFDLPQPLLLLGIYLITNPRPHPKVGSSWHGRALNSSDPLCPQGCLLPEPHDPRASRKFSFHWLEQYKKVLSSHLLNLSSVYSPPPHGLDAAQAPPPLPGLCGSNRAPCLLSSPSSLMWKDMSDHTHPTQQFQVTLPCSQDKANLLHTTYSAQLLSRLHFLSWSSSHA